MRRVMVVVALLLLYLMPVYADGWTLLPSYPVVQGAGDGAWMEYPGNAVYTGFTRDTAWGVSNGAFEPQHILGSGERLVRVQTWDIDGRTVYRVVAERPVVDFYNFPLTGAVVDMNSMMVWGGGVSQYTNRVFCNYGYGVCPESTPLYNRGW